MIKKVKTKLNSLKLKYCQILNTYFIKFKKKSDIERWKQDKSLFSSWDERTEMLANQVKPYSTVFEFGSAKLVLKDMLPVGCVYFNSDIVKRNKDTLVVDLNQYLPQISKVDYIIFSGVLEYLFDVKSVLLHFSQYTNNFVFSYATTEAFSNKSVRRYNGLVDDLSENDFISIAKEMDMTFEVIGHWKSQSLYHFKKLL